MGKGRALIFVFLLILMLSRAMAQENVNVGDVHKSFKADLNADGKKETVELLVFARKEVGWFGTLHVKDSSGKSLWSGPREADSGNPLVFGAWDYGVTIPEILGDIDGDGKIEIIAPEPQSDVRPVRFRVLRWEGGKFNHLFSKSLIEKTKNSGKYPYSTSGEYTGRWISEFRKLNNDGSIEVNIMEYLGDTGGMSGSAIVKSDAKGFHILRWKEQLKPF